jgi:hypothetical protein
MYLFSGCSHLEHRACMKRFVSLQLLYLRQLVELLGRGMSPTHGKNKYRISGEWHLWIYWDSKPRSSVETGGDSSCFRPRCCVSYIGNWIFQSVAFSVKWITIMSHASPLPQSYFPFSVQPRLSGRARFMCAGWWRGGGAGLIPNRTYKRTACDFVLNQVSDALLGDYWVINRR